MNTYLKGAELNPDVPPNDAGSEHDVLGCLLIDPKLIAEARGIIDVADFWAESSRIVFQAVIDAVQVVPDFPDCKAVIRELAHVGAMERIGGEAFLTACIDRIADATNIPAYCRQVKSFSNRRKVMDASCRAHYAAMTGTDFEGTLREVIDAMQVAKPGRVSDAGPVILCMADVTSRPVSYLWPGRVPLGRITLLVGRPGEGKSFLTTDMASRVTTGTPWPDGSDCPHGSVILVSAEDDPSDTIRPRLDAHRADASRVHLLTGVRRLSGHGNPCETMFTLADLPALEAVLQRVSDCKLIVIDPIGSFLGGETDAHRDNEVRGVLAPVAKLAEKYGPAVLIVAHRRKGAGDFADDTALGSRAFTGIARATWHLSRDPNDKSRRLLLPGKNNLGPEGTGLAFSIGGEPAALHWESDSISMSADEGMANERGDRNGGRTERDDAADWLRTLLAGGPKNASDMEREARDAGYSMATVRRAKATIGVISRKPAFGGPWEWALPEGAHHPKALTEDAQLRTSEHLGEKRVEDSEIQPKVLTLETVGILGEHLRGNGQSVADPTDWGIRHRKEKA